MVKIIQPGIFEAFPHVNSCFTEANRDVPILHNKKQRISGLNFGLNSDGEESEIQSSYKTLFKALKWNQQKLAIARQVHSDHITVVDKPGVYDQTDGLITTRRGLALGIQVADCVAILVADTNPDNPVIGAFHAGWRGALSGIVEKGIEKMIQCGGYVESFRAYISPCISIQKFEVGEEVASAFPSKYCDYESYSKPHIDLKSFVLDQLINSGLQNDQIECSPDCTVSDLRYYSYRRERLKSGRMLGLIKLAEEDPH